MTKKKTKFSILIKKFRSTLRTRGTTKAFFFSLFLSGSLVISLLSARSVGNLNRLERGDTVSPSWMFAQLDSFPPAHPASTLSPEAFGTPTRYNTYTYSEYIYAFTYTLYIDYIHAYTQEKLTIQLASFLYTYVSFTNHSSNTRLCLRKCCELGLAPTNQLIAQPLSIVYDNIYYVNLIVVLDF